ncbi:S8 family serine peptidase [Verrucosispora sp. TAA-831]|uniref:S8 family serine peptidase n=1 Tax=Verrucosispora sp. TAA-831 TaxID=3422227 RepID=UPI003D6FBC31
MMAQSTLDQSLALTVKEPSKAATALGIITVSAILAAHSLPTNPLADTRSHLGNEVRNDQWHLPFLKVDEAHQISQGEGVIVAIPDTGVYPHPDLRKNLLPGIDLLSNEDRTSKQDQDSHGTAMAGLVAAHGNTDGHGALGVAPKAKVLPIRSSPPNRPGEPDALARAIELAISHRADIISISSVGGSSARLVRAINSAIEADILVVAGTGNRPRESTIGYPASHVGVVAVGGIDRKGNHAPLSAIGPQVSVTAPAIELYSTSYGGGYSKGSGTSGATAIVAGAAALVRAKYPYLPADEVAHRLTATAIDKGPPGRDDQYGYGVIDLVAALTADVPPRGFGPSGTGTPSPSTTRAGGPEADEDGAAVRGLVTLAVLLAVGAGGLWWVRRRRRSGDPPPRVSR